MDPKGGSQREVFNPRKEGRRGAGSEEWEGGWRLGVRWGLRWWRQGPGSEGSEVGAVGWAEAGRGRLRNCLNYE